VSSVHYFGGKTKLCLKAQMDKIHLDPQTITELDKLSTEIADIKQGIFYG